MDLEETSAEETPQPGADGGRAASTDGLAGAIANEHRPEETGSGGEGTLEASRRRPGRPPIHGRYSQAAGSDGKNPAPAPGEEPLSTDQVEGDPAERVVIPPDVFADVVSDTLALGEEFATYKVETVAQRAGLTPEEYAPQLKRAQIGEKRKATIAKLTPLAMEEHGMDSNVSPTGAILFLMGTWALTATSGYLTLAKIAAEREARLRREAEERKAQP